MDGMKKFVDNVLLEWISEIKRSEMPQVKNKKIPEILKIFDEYDIEYHEGLVECGKLKHIQEDYKPEKVKSMVDSMKKGEWEASPVFISNDGYVLDGNHRVIAYKKVYGDDYKIPAISVDLPHKDALHVFSVGADKVNEDIEPALHRLADSFGAEIVDDDMNIRLKNINEINGNKVIVVFPGRFQVFHRNHYEVYQHLIKKFGKNNVYIATSNKVEPEKSPFNFVEKKKIMTKMFGMPSNKILQVDILYNNKSYKSLGDMNKDILVIGLGEKDAGRLTSSGKFYDEYKKGSKEPFGKKGYVYTVPLKLMKVGGKLISGTVIRNIFKQGTDKAKKQLFKKLFGKFDQGIYNLIVGKLNESVILSSVVIDEFILYTNIKKIIYESTVAADGQVDDGPATFYKHPSSYHKDVKDITGKLGWQIIDYLAGDKNEYADQQYKYDHVSDVSFGDVGVRDTTYPDPIAKYKSHMEHIAARLGYKIIDWLMTDKKKDNIIDDPESKMATHEPLQQNTSNAAKPLEEQLFSKEWWTKNIMIDKQLLKDIIHSDDSLDYRELLLCGGAYGHMQHPFEDWNLTFGDIRGLIEAGLEGKLEMAQEKTDGQNLMVTWKDGELRAARRKGHLKNAGAEAMTRKQVSDMFAGRGAIHDAFVFAMEDLESALSKLSDKDKESIFNNGQKFMSLEIIYPATENIIPYDLSTLLFHGAIEYDVNGNSIGEDKSSAGKLNKLIKDVNAEVQKNFTLGDSPVIKLPKVADYSTQKKKFIGKLNKLKSEFKLKDTDKVTEYHKQWWEKFILDQANKMKYPIPNDILVKLVNRWALAEKSAFKVGNMKKQIDHDKFKDWALKFDKKDQTKQMETNVKPFELLFLGLGAQIMKNVSNLLTANPDKAVQKMKKEVEKAAKELENSKDVTKMEKFKKQMMNLKAIGGVDVIAPSEGLVFMYNNKLYKLVGSFQPVHHIISLLKFA